MNGTRGLAILGLLAGVLVGCGPGLPPPKTYVLPEPELADASPISQVGAPIIAVRLVDVPDYLDTTDIVTRGPDGLIIPRDSARWGERLSVGLTRAVTARLSARFPRCLVTASPPSRVPRWRARIEIEALDVAPDGPATMTARWSIADGVGGQVVAAERITLTASGDLRTDAAAVAAIGRDVDQLVDRIATALAPEIGG